MRMDAAEPLVKALLHSLWQGPLAAGGLYGVLRLLPARRAGARYGVSLLALVMVLLGVCITWAVLARPAGAAGGGPVVVRGMVEAAPAGAAWTGGGAAAGATRVDGFAVAAWVWAAGVAVMLVRTWRAVSRAGALLAQGEAVEDPRVLAMVREVARRLGVSRAVRVVSSAAYGAPAVVGAWSPVVLLPAALVSGGGVLEAERLRLILAHELAHIRRHDYFVDLLQRVLEALLFFNPAVWWLGRQIRAEREACCDAAASAMLGDATLTARTLAEVAAEAMGLAAGLEQAFPARRPSMLRDRVRRLLFPEALPEMRLPLGTFLAALGAATALVLVMQSTAVLTVRAAAELLTPAQRVEKIAELQAKVSGENDRKTATVVGSVVREDGGPLPAGTAVTGMGVSPNRIQALNAKVQADGTFTMRRVQASRVLAMASAEGFAPAFAEGAVDANGEVGPLKLVLSRGFEARVRLVDPAGEPVVGAKAALSYERENAANWYNTLETGTSGADGEVRVAHAATRRARLVIEAPGFAYDIAELALRPGDPQRVVLQHARLTEGVVQDGAGKPVAGASVWLVSRHGFDNWVNYPFESRTPAVAVSDGAGRFVLDGLRDDCVYAFRATAAGHGGELLTNVRAGEKGLRFELGAPRPVRVRVLADAGMMPKTVEVRHRLKLGDAEYDYATQAAVEVKGEEGRAEVADPLPGPVAVGSGERAVTVMPAEGGTEAVLDLRGSAAEKTRAVVVRFDLPAGAPAPRGRVWVYYRGAAGGEGRGSREVVLGPEGGRAEVPAPSRVRVGAGQEASGYFIEDSAEVALAEGSEPLVVTLKAQPAGAVHGRLLDADGTPVKEHAYVAVAASAGPAELRNVQGYNVDDGAGRYLLSPVGLGGTYQLMASCGTRFAVSEPLTIDSDHPVMEADLRFGEGVRVAGKVVGPDGKAAQAELLLVASMEHFASTARVTVDREGRFVMEHLDASLPVKFSLQVAPGRETVGQKVAFVPKAGQELVIALVAGVTGKVRVTNDATNKPVANARVRLMPVEWAKAAYDGTIFAVTDGEGVFELHNLEPIDYHVYVDDTYPPGSVVRVAENGVRHVETPATWKSQPLRAGRGEVLEMRVVVSP
jgi:beta-lactamase regulating signal transducer with metallopeptidase domain